MRRLKTLFCVGGKLAGKPYFFQVKLSVVRTFFSLIGDSGKNKSLLLNSLLLHVLRESAVAQANTVGRRVALHKK